MHFTPPNIYQGNTWAGRTIGLLGGSFNPAHLGHRHISLYALKMLGLDAVWWMVSPQNPNKPTKGMAPLAERLQTARDVSAHPKIVATDIEKDMGTRYTIDTLQQLRLRFPKTKFIWLMGTDNLQQFHRWHDWQDIFRLVPICVLDRPPRTSIVQHCPTQMAYGRHLLDQRHARELKFKPLPAWTILHIPLNDISSTLLRAKARNEIKK